MDLQQRITAAFAGELDPEAGWQATREAVELLDKGQARVAEKIDGKKTGKFLMDKFDPQRKKDKKSKTRRRQVRVSVRWSDGGERVMSRRLTRLRNRASPVGLQCGYHGDTVSNKDGRETSCPVKHKRSYTVLHALVNCRLPDRITPTKSGSPSLANADLSRARPFKTQGILLGHAGPNELDSA